MREKREKKSDRENVRVCERVRKRECESKSERKRVYGNIIKLLFSLLLLYN